MVEAVLETDAALDAQFLVYRVRFLAISHYRALRAAKCAQRTTVTERWVNTESDKRPANAGPTLLIHHVLSVLLGEVPQRRQQGVGGRLS